MLEIPEATPYWGVLKELGIWPIRMQVDYQRMMLFENIMTSNRERLGRWVLEDQKKREMKNTFYDEIKKTGERYQINIEQAGDLGKTEWKKYFKKKIWNVVWEISRGKEINMKKLRHQTRDKFEMKKYLKETATSDSKKILRLRLEMLDIGNNYGKGRQCFGCGNNEETWEHITDCQEVRRVMTGTKLINKEWIHKTQEEISYWKQ